MLEIRCWHFATERDSGGCFIGWGGLFYRKRFYSRVWENWSGGVMGKRKESDE